MLAGSSTGSIHVRATTRAEKPKAALRVLA
jgi:hypothetical protein